MAEEWKPVVGYEGLYEVSDKGRVRSLYRILKNGILTKRVKPYYPHQHKGRCGHLSVWFYKDGEGKRFLVHRVVAMAFIPNPNNYPIINHKDETPDNNNVDNLEWCTYAYNNSYGTIKERMRNILLNRSDLSIRVIRRSKDGLIKEYPSMQEAARDNNVFQGNIWKCCNGERHTCGGYFWNYK